MLRNPKLVNSNRGFTTYTGHYDKRRVTVATHGIGGPSAAIVLEELHMLGVQTIVRFGTAGGLVPGLGIGDFVIPTGAACSGGSVQAYARDTSTPAVPDPDLTGRLVRACKKRGLKAREGLVYSSDGFYTQDLKFLRPWIRKGALAVEMECAMMFTLASLRDFRAAALLLLSNSLVDKSESKLAGAKQLRPFVESGALAVLDALVGHP